MAKRKKLNRRTDRGYFTRTAMKMHPKNKQRQPNRGGHYL